MNRNIELAIYRNIELAIYRNIEIAIYRNIELAICRIERVLPPIPWPPQFFKC